MAEVALSAYKGSAPGLGLSTGTATALSLGGASGSLQSANASDIDNTANLYGSADFYLSIAFGVAPTTGGVILLYLVPYYNTTGSTWVIAQVNGTTDAPAQYIAGAFSVVSQTAAQVQILRDVPLGPGKYKAYLRNMADQNSSSNWTLSARFFNRTVV